MLTKLSERGMFSTSEDVYWLVISETATMTDEPDC
jgi:hypothetical protein